MAIFAKWGFAAHAFTGSLHFCINYTFCYKFDECVTFLALLGSKILDRDLNFQILGMIEEAIF